VGIFTDTALELYPPDYWRYYIMKIAPERHDTDFLWTEFRDSINNELADILGNFVHRTLTFINNNFEGKVPTRSKLEKEDKAILSLLEEVAKNADSEMRKLEFQRTLLVIFDFARECNKYFQSKKPWADLKSNNTKRAATTMSICTQCCRGLAVLLAPYIPFSTEEIFNQLNLKENIHKQSWLSITEKMPDKHKVKQEVNPIFKKIELEEIIELGLKWGSDSIKEVLEKNPDLDPLKKKKKHAPKKTPPKKKEKKVTKELISFKEFQKLDLRVGTIKTIEAVKDANKLVKIKVDIGTEERQIVAGIAERYKPEELIGKQIIVVCNLEPAKIRGVESNGMLLAADADPEISVLVPLREVPDGSKVR
jgi:methionyl-tRNA synthetase